MEQIKIFRSQNKTKYLQDGEWNTRQNSVTCQHIVRCWECVHNSSFQVKSWQSANNIIRLSTSDREQRLEFTVRVFPDSAGRHRTLFLPCTCGSFLRWKSHAEPEWVYLHETADGLRVGQALGYIPTYISDTSYSEIATVTTYKRSNNISMSVSLRRRQTRSRKDKYNSTLLMCEWWLSVEIFSLVQWRHLQLLNNTAHSDTGNVKGSSQDSLVRCILH